MSSEVHVLYRVQQESLPCVEVIQRVAASCSSVEFFGKFRSGVYLGVKRNLQRPSSLSHLWVVLWLLGSFLQWHVSLIR